MIEHAFHKEGEDNFFLRQCTRTPEQLRSQKGMVKLRDMRFCMIAPENRAWLVKGGP